MALPKIATPFYELNVPSNGKTIKYRPFLVKEEKILLMAMESGKDGEVSNALKQIIKNCTDGQVDVEELPMFDIEYIFLQLRTKSVDEVSSVTISCKECREPFRLDLNLNDIKVHFPEKKQDFKIQLTSDVGIIMKYPTMTMVKNVTEGDTESSGFLFDIISTCVESIYDEEQVYNEFSKEEIDDFVDNLPQEQFKKISDFFENMPKLKHDVKFTCPKCKHKNKSTLAGLQDFFGSASLTTV